MASQTMDCPKCKARMEEGFIIEYMDFNHTQVSNWVEGQPTDNRVLGLSAGLKTKDRRMLPVSSFRCTGCGYVESYAK
jgi:hypothetical protein